MGETVVVEVMEEMVYEKETDRLIGYYLEYVFDKGTGRLIEQRLIGSRVIDKGV